MTTDEIDMALDVSSLQTLEENHFNLHQEYYYIPATAQGFDASVFVECDGYDGPLGKGYTISVWNDSFERVMNFGPEIERELPWTSLE